MFRVRIRVSFLSRPIHCKHLSLIESTTARVTSPNVVGSFVCLFFSFELMFSFIRPKSAKLDLKIKQNDQKMSNNIMLSRSKMSILPVSRPFEAFVHEDDGLFEVNPPNLQRACAPQQY